jgi:hypothetical protein
MQDARWLFFDLGNTLISEETAWERRIQRLVSSLEPLTGIIAYLEAGAGGMAARTAKLYGEP